MNKRLIARFMQARVNGLRHSGVYFFRGDFEHVLTGVVLDYVPRGLHIENFRFPLFDFAGPNLTYSDRLREHSFIEKGEMSEEAIVDFVLSSPEVRSAFEARSSMGLPEFVDFLESDCLINASARLIHAAALVLLGEESRALDLLSILPQNLHPTKIPYWNQLRTSLQQGPEVARALLDQVRQENLRAFGLDTD